MTRPHCKSVLAKLAAQPAQSITRAEAGDILDETQAAAYLHTKRRTIRLWRRTRGLPHFKPTQKVVLFRRCDLDAWLDQSRVATMGAVA